MLQSDPCGNSNIKYIHDNIVAVGEPEKRVRCAMQSCDLGWSETHLELFFCLYFDVNIYPNRYIYRERMRDEVAAVV